MQSLLTYGTKHGQNFGHVEEWSPAISLEIPGLRGGVHVTHGCTSKLHLHFQKAKKSLEILYYHELENIKRSGKGIWVF